MDVIKEKLARMHAGLPARIEQTKSVDELITLLDSVLRVVKAEKAGDDGLLRDTLDFMDDDWDPIER